MSQLQQLPPQSKIVVALANMKRKKECSYLPPLAATAGEQPTRCMVERGLHMVHVSHILVKNMRDVKTRQLPTDDEMRNTKLGYVTYFVHKHSKSTANESGYIEGQFKEAISYRMSPTAAVRCFTYTNRGRRETTTTRPIRTKVTHCCRTITQAARRKRQTSKRRQDDLSMGCRDDVPDQTDMVLTKTHWFLNKYTMSSADSIITDVKYMPIATANTQRDRTTPKCSKPKFYKVVDITSMLELYPPPLTLTCTRALNTLLLTAEPKDQQEQLHISNRRKTLDRKYVSLTTTERNHRRLIQLITERDSQEEDTMTSTRLSLARQLLSVYFDTENVAIRSVESVQLHIQRLIKTRSLQLHATCTTNRIRLAKAVLSIEAKSMCLLRHHQLYFLWQLTEILSIRQENLLTAVTQKTHSF